MTRPNPARSLSLLAIAAIVAAACGGNTSSPSPSAGPASAAPSASHPPSPSPSAAGTPLPSAEAARVFDAIEAQVLAIRGLASTKVERQTLDEAALKASVSKSFTEDNPPEYVAASERLLKAMGLMPEADSLKDLYLDLLGSQVAGFYDPDKKELFVVSRSGTINGADKITFAHEYDHALQDANFDVFAAQKELLDESDQALARAAVYEGDATLLMVLWAQANLTPEEFAEVQSAGSDPESLEILARTPSILVDGLLFPYTAGQAFVLPIQLSGGWAAVDALYADLPRSTEQILHPAKYEAAEEPVAVTLPDVAADLGTGWDEAIQDTFGEFQMRTWLREAGVRSADASDAAEGWGGDRLAVLNGTDDAWALVMKTEWDTTADAAEFEAAAETAVDAAGGPAAVLPGEGGKVRWFVVASDDGALNAVTGALGLAG
jgi:hypothetical protein